MHDELASSPSRNDEISCFLNSLRAAARSGGQLVLPPEQVRILLADEIYMVLSRLEAESFRKTGLEDIYQTPSASAVPANQPDVAPQQGTNVRDPSAAGPSTEPPDTPCVEALIAEWLKFHVSRLAAPDRYHYSAGHLRTFFNDERLEVYDASAAAQAWDRALGFLRTHLG